MSETLGDEYYPSFAPFLGFAGCAAAMILSCAGAAIAKIRYWYCWYRYFQARIDHEIIDSRSYVGYFIGVWIGCFSVDCRWIIAARKLLVI